MEIFAKIVNGLQPLTIFVKNSILDVWPGYEYASVVHVQGSVKYCSITNIIEQIDSEVKSDYSSNNGFSKTRRRFTNTGGELLVYNCN